MNIMFQVGSWHYDKGGTDLFVKTIAHWLATKGHKVVVLAHKLEEENCSNEDIKQGKGIIKVRYTPKQRKGIRFNPFVYLYRLLVTSKYLYSLAKKEEIDAIIVGETELLSVLPLKFTKTKIICRGGALLYETMKREVLKEKGKSLSTHLFIAFLKAYNDFTLKLPDAFVPVNQSEYRFLNKKKSKKAQILTIPHGIPTNLFKPLKKRTSKKVIVGYVGRLAPIKYPEVVLEMFRQASEGANSEFWWIGPLDPFFEKDYFKTLKKKLQIKNAKYLGKIQNKELPKYLNKLDIFLQAEQQTNVSRSTTEAAACGLPIVALNQGSEEYGFFTMDHEKAVDKLKSLIQDKKQREKQGKKAREIILQNFSEEKIYSKYVDLIKKLIKPNQ